MEEDFDKLDKELIRLGFEDTGVVNFIHLTGGIYLEWDGFNFILDTGGLSTIVKGIKTIDDVRLFYKLITNKEL